MRRGIGSYPGDDDGARRDFFPRDRDDSTSRDERFSKKVHEVGLFVHKVLPKSLLCSEHGRNDYINRELVGGKIIPWSKITWPVEGEHEKFRDWQKRTARQPVFLKFAVPEWLAYEKGLI